MALVHAEADKPRQRGRPRHDLSTTVSALQDPLGRGSCHDKSRAATVRLSISKQLMPR